MTTRTKASLWASALLFLLTGTVGYAVERPNVLFIAVDDLRPALGCYGNEEVITPHIDRLAARSTRFSKAYVNSPVCGSSRASLLTGLRVKGERFVAWNCRVDEDAPGEPTLPQVFREHGYRTISNGKVFHHRNDAAERSWSEAPFREGGLAWVWDFRAMGKVSERGRGPFVESAAVEDEAYGDGRLAAKTVADLQRLKEAGEPFFLVCGFVRPHLPFNAPKKYWDLYDAEKLSLATNRFRPEGAPEALQGSNEILSYHQLGYDRDEDFYHRLAIHGYYACVSYIDAQVGKIMQTLEELELMENTIVVFWGDHGFHLGEHTFFGKHNTLDGAIRVPLMVKLPGQAQGQVTEGLVETVDIFPTLVELARLPSPEGLEGMSFADLLRDPTREGKAHGYTRFYRQSAVFDTRYILSCFEGSEGEADAFMLFDLQEDPQENRNVYGLPRYEKVVDRLQPLFDVYR